MKKSDIKPNISWITPLLFSVIAFITANVFLVSGWDTLYIIGQILGYLCLIFSFWFFIIEAFVRALEIFYGQERAIKKVKKK